VSEVVGTRWFRECGGVTPQSVFHEDSGRYLSFVEREQIALWHAKKMGVRQIARQLNRSPSTVFLQARPDRLGVCAADLLSAAPDRAPAPTFANYIPVVRAAVSPGTRRVFGSYSPASDGPDL
jgi:hypothetical protein